MAKLKDCRECSHRYSMWEALLNSTRYEFSRRMAKRELKAIKRDHNKLRRHDWPWQGSVNGTYVSGCYKRTLIHNGGK